MRILLRSHTWYIAAAVLLIAIAVSLLWRVITADNEVFVTTVVEKSTVQKQVSVSGFIESNNAATLAFPVSGIVASVPVSEGDTVTAGDVLVSLDQNTLNAEWRSAYAGLLDAQAKRELIIAGPQAEARVVTNTTITNAEAALARAKSENAEKVSNARRALYSSNLTAFAKNSNEDAAAPVVTGTFTCELAAEDTSYELDVYNSGASSGYSYRLTGFERGTFSAYTDQPAPLGSCGLRVQFDENSLYGNSTWAIDIPNKSGANYITNLNALLLAEEQGAAAIAAAEDALDLARQTATLENASPRTETLAQADAAVEQAAAAVAGIDALLAERTLRAPFDGLVTSLDILPGETVTTAPVVTLLSDSAFTMTARIPEIDIADIAPLQRVVMRFDAQADEEVFGTISFISPVAVEIDGVAYFEATIAFTESPTWLRSGLNADVDIIIEKREDVLAIPRRFIHAFTTDPQVRILSNDTESVMTPVTIEFIGNDGLVAISGVSEGAVVIAP